jgi:hypothetical protein
MGYAWKVLLFFGSNGAVCAIASYAYVRGGWEVWLGALLCLSIIRVDQMVTLRERLELENNQRLR